MKYCVDLSQLKVREELDGTASIFIRPSKQVLYLNKTASEIIRNAGEITDSKDLAEYVIAKFNYNPADKSRIIEDLEDTVYLLSTYSVLKLIEDKNDDPRNTVRVAGEKDYVDISDFIKRNINNPENYFYNDFIELYSPVPIRTRQFNNLEYNILAKKEGRIVAILTLAIPPKMSTALSVILVAFECGLSKETSISVMEQMLNYSSGLFKKSMKKYRVNIFNEKQRGVSSMFDNLGFREITRYVNETRDGNDLIVLDRPL